jgi:cation:H+ antiporter
MWTGKGAEHMSLWLELALMLVIILISAQLFSNALEYFSENAGLSSGGIIS